jgi:hypothetical protein
VRLPRTVSQQLSLEYERHAIFTVRWENAQGLDAIKDVITLFTRRQLAIKAPAHQGGAKVILDMIR